MARPVQPLGTLGVITVRRTSRGYVALTRFREHSGVYRRVTATGESRAAAENRLKERIAAGLADLYIRAVDAETGELLRELVLDPTKDYQPLGRPPGPPPRTA
jgi:hypothetical protein